MADVSQAEEADIDDAVDAATKAQKQWENMAPIMRSLKYHKLSQLIIENGKELGRLETIAMGK